MALSLNNVNAVLSAEMSLSGFPFSMLGWFRVPDVTTFTSLMGVISTSTGARCDVYFAGDGTKEAVAKTKVGSSTGSALSTLPMTPGKWHHLTAVFSSDAERKIYIDGGNLGVNNDNLPISAMSVFYFGNFYASELVDVAEVSVVKTVVSAEQAAAFASGSPVLASPYSRDTLSYHDCIRQTNHPGLGPKFIVIGSPAITDHPRVLHAVGGYSTAMPNRFQGPWHVEQSLARSLPIAQGQLSVAGVSKSDTILSGEVTV